MGTTLTRMVGSIAAVLVAIAGGTGCLLSNDEPTDEAVSSRGNITAGGDTSAVLASTLVLETGCIATKIGPKLLLTAARCTTSDAVAKGKSIGYVVASTGAAGAGDAGDALTKRSFVLADVLVHTSFETKCAAGACAHGKVEASDAADVAVLVLEEDLESIAAVRVDLDAVGDADPLLVVSSGCSSLAGRGAGGVRAGRTLAVPARAAGHEGSAYAFAPDLIARVAAAYTLSAGIGWKNDGAKLCSADIGAPIFRAGAAAVAGVTSTYTTLGPGGSAPVTVLHARVDAQSRFKVGAWLASLGASTLHSCSESAVGCVKRSYDGGMPDNLDETTSGAKDPTSPAPKADAGAPDVAPAPAADAGPSMPTVIVEEQLPGEDTGYQGGDTYASDEDYADAAVEPKRANKSDAGGCSAAPGGAAASAPAGTSGLGLAIVLGLAAVRRRRGASAQSGIGTSLTSSRKGGSPSRATTALSQGR